MPHAQVKLFAQGDADYTTIRNWLGGAKLGSSCNTGANCQVIFANSTQHVDTWTFTWTAPQSGAVHVYWGAVDGDCDMMSMNDAAVTGSMTLSPPPAAIRWLAELYATVRSSL